jgi:hypothetical protein
MIRFYVKVPVWIRVGFASAGRHVVMLSFRRELADRHVIDHNGLMAGVVTDGLMACPVTEGCTVCGKAPDSADGGSPLHFGRGGAK